MALILVGKSKCAICGEVLTENQELTGLPPLIANRRDPLHIFSDAAFLKSCFEAHPLSKQVLEIKQKLRAIFNSKKCAICHEPIESPDDHFTTGYLVAEGQLAGFNYLQMHVNCISDWPEKREFEKALDEAISTKTFENEYTVRYFNKVLLNRD